MKKPILTALLAMTVAASPVCAKTGIDITNPETGAAVTLPEEWNFTIEGPTVIATSPDDRALVVLVEAGEDFEDEAMRIEEVLTEQVLIGVIVDEAYLLVGSDRGGLAGAVVARGTAVHEADGLPVEFFSMLVKDAQGNGGLILGAWKKPEYKEVITKIVRNVRMEEPSMASGLELRDRRTGAAVRLPEGWRAHSSRHGLIATEPEGRAMALLMAPEQSFRETVAVTRVILREAVFDDIEIGEFVKVEGEDARGGVEVVRATGTATHRRDGAPVEFVAVIGEIVEQNRGVMVVGVWKDDDQREPIAEILESLELPRATNPANDASSAGWNHYGMPGRDTGSVIAVADIAGGESDVVVTGRITDVCAKKGCWMRVADGADELFVRFQDYGFFVPMNAAGHEVVMHGTAVAEIASVEELRHYAEDAGKSPEEIAAITEPEERITFFADSVYIAGPGLDEPWSPEQD